MKTAVSLIALTAMLAAGALYAADTSAPAKKEPAPAVHDTQATKPNAADNRTDEEDATDGDVPPDAEDVPEKPAEPPVEPK